MLVALGVMSILWMGVITVVVLAQKPLSAKAAIDAPALAIIGLGIPIILALAGSPAHPADVRRHPAARATATTCTQILQFGARSGS